MSNKRQRQEWQPEIDQGYEQRMSNLQRMEHTLPAATPVRQMTDADREELGLTRPGRNTYVPAPAQRSQPQLPQQATTGMVIEATPHATSHVEVRTSHQDRAWGFTISISQLSAIIALAIIVVRPWWSPAASFWEYASLAYFVSIYAVCWFVGYVLSNIVLTPEFANLFGAIGQLWLLRNEQRERWDWYKRQEK